MQHEIQLHGFLLGGIRVSPELGEAPGAAAYRHFAATTTDSLSGPPCFQLTKGRNLIAAQTL